MTGSSDPHLTGCPRCDLSDALAAHNGAGDCPPGSSVQEPERTEGGI